MGTQAAPTLASKVAGSRNQHRLSAAPGGKRAGRGCLDLAAAHPHLSGGRCNRGERCRISLAFNAAARAERIGMGRVSILDIRAEWKLIGYFCLGYSIEEEDVPLLETLGWEERRTGPSFLIHR
jgi:hypothetical protein